MRSGHVATGFTHPHAAARFHAYTRRTRTDARLTGQGVVDTSRVLPALCAHILIFTTTVVDDAVGALLLFTPGIREGCLLGGGLRLGRSCGLGRTGAAPRPYAGGS